MDGDDFFGVFIVLLGVGLVGVMSYGAVRLVKSLNKDSEVASDSTATHQSIDSVANSLDSVSANKNYVLDSADLAQMTNNAKVGQPIFYRGVEVDALKAFPNAKLVGVDNFSVALTYGSGPTSYLTKGLLFELDSNKVVNLISSTNAFYLGQRYDISYCPFKKGASIGGAELVKMFFENRDKDLKAVKSMDKKYNNDYDGILLNYKLSKRK